MIRATVDIFSGRENPSFLVDGSDARELLRDISRSRASITDRDAGYTGLGLRGVHIEMLSDDHPLDLPHEFKIGGGGSLDDLKAFDLVERVIRLMRKYRSTLTSPDLDDNLEKYLLTQLEERQSLPGRITSLDGTTEEKQDVTCQIEKGKFNPAFWNTPNVQPYNNCYNYASNFRTNTFAQPGKGAGSQYTSLSCPEVTRAALADGCHRRFDCFPETEKPRWLMALVVAPGHDYHWYRLQQEGFWGHKPGSTPAKNVDNNGAVINNPETCARSPYTDFCGYFYSCTTQQHRIK